MANEKTLTRDEAEDLLEEYVCAQKNWEDYANRSEWVPWSEEKEHEAWKEMDALRKRIISLIVGE
jgi:hypothetical protein